MVWNKVNMSEPGDHLHTCGLNQATEMTYDLWSTSPSPWWRTSSGASSSIQLEKSQESYCIWTASFLIYYSSHLGTTYVEETLIALDLPPPPRVSDPWPLTITLFWRSRCLVNARERRMTRGATLRKHAAGRLSLCGFYCKHGNSQQCHLHTNEVPLDQSTPTRRNALACGFRESVGSDPVSSPWMNWALCIRRKTYTWHIYSAYN